MTVLTEPPQSTDSEQRPGRSFSTPEIAVMIGVPLLWAILLLFHPSGDGKEIYLDLRDQVTSAVVVHVGMLLFIPLMAVVMYRLLLRGIEERRRGSAASRSCPSSCSTAPGRP